MEDLTKRQSKILEIVIREYIYHASPISSKFIEEKYDLGVSPATIRNEMFELIEKKYLFQPHTSSGRVPTDKGYRFFVNLLSESQTKELEKRIVKEIVQMKKEIDGRVHFIREFTRFLAQTSSSLTVSYFPKENLLYKEGWKEVLQDPEFIDIAKIHEFTTMVSDFEENIDSFLGQKKEDNVQIIIGSESPFSKQHGFSILLSPCSISRKKGLLAIIGPKRMPYDKNILLVESIIKLLKNNNER